MIPALVVLLAALALLLLPGLPVPLVVVGLVVLRTFTDVGAPSSGPQPLNSALAGAVGLTFLVLALLAGRGAPPLPGGVRRLIAALVVVVLVWTLVGVLQFGVDGTMLSESLRLLSVLAAFSCGVRFAQRGGRLLTVWPALVVLPAALALLLLFASGAEVGLESGRASGTFSHSNSAAAFFAAGALVLIYAFFRRRSALMLVSALLAGAALLATGSIGSALGIVAGAAAMFLARPGVRVGARVLAAVVVAGAAAGFILASNTGQRIQEFNDYDPSSALAGGTSTDSLEWRLVNWSSLLRIWAASPVFGWGVGSTSERLQPLGAPPHSMPVQVLVEYGVVGFVVLLVLAIWSLRRLLRAARGTQEFGLVIGLVVFAVVTGSESNLLDYTAVDYLLAVTVGVAVGRIVSPTPTPTPTQRVPNRRPALQTS